MEEDEDEEELPDLPDKCPICDKQSKNLLLHIKKKESCNSKIDPKLYEYWKDEQNRYSKRKYQATYIKKGKHNHAQEKYMKTSKHQNAKKRYLTAGKQRVAQARYMETEKYHEPREKYVEAGKHRMAQAKYEEKFRYWCKVCEMKVVKPFQSYKEEYKIYQRKYECKCPPVDRESFLQTKRRNKSRSRNRGRIRCGQYDVNIRLEGFKKLCLLSLKSLKRGNLHNSDFNKFHLVEGETVLEYYDDNGETVYDVEEKDYDDIHSWLSQVDGTLLCMVIIFQNVVLVPKSRWLRAIKEVTTNEDMKYLSDELYRLIGKLQSYENENTKDISIPEEFKSSKALNDADWSSPETLSNKEEILLIDLLEDLVGEEHVSEDLQVLLRILDENLEAALLYAK